MIYFNEMSMVLLIQQNENLQKELASLGYDSSDKGLEQMKVLINNNFLNYKCKRALNKIFKKHVENATGYIPAMYDGLELNNRKFEPVDGHRFYVYNIYERNGEHEYNHKSVIQLDADQDPDKWLEDYTSDFYGGGSEKEGDSYWFNGWTFLCEAHGMTEISKDEFDVVKRYI
jgi:hypothetical protein